MKKQLLFMGALAGSMALLISFSSGPTSSVGDVTGSPLSNGDCSLCHGGGNYNPTLTVEMLDGDDPVAEYVPGETYRLRITIDAVNDPAGYGFQAVALSGGDDANAGMFENPGTDVNITPFDDRQYAEHNKRSTNNTFEVDWVAPAEGTGDVRLYVSGNAVNGAGTSGDSPVSLTSPVVLTEGETSSVPTIASLEALTAFPNPVESQLNLLLESSKAHDLDVQIASLDGKNLHNQVWPVQAGGNNLQYDASGLPAGTYLVRLSDGRGVETRLFVKK